MTKSAKECPATERTVDDVLAEIVDLLNQLCEMGRSRKAWRGSRHDDRSRTRAP